MVSNVPNPNTNSELDKTITEFIFKLTHSKKTLLGYQFYKYIEPDMNPTQTTLSFLLIDDSKNTVIKISALASKIPPLVGRVVALDFQAVAQVMSLEEVELAREELVALLRKCSAPKLRGFAKIVALIR